MIRPGQHWTGQSGRFGHQAFRYTDTESGRLKPLPDYRRFRQEGRNQLTLAAAVPARKAATVGRWPRLSLDILKPATASAVPGSQSSRESRPGIVAKAPLQGLARPAAIVSARLGPAGGACSSLGRGQDGEAPGA